MPIISIARVHILCDTQAMKLQITNLNHAALTEAGLVRSGNTMHDARKQADLNDCAVIYPGPYGHRVAMQGDSRTGDMHVEFWGKFDDVVEKLKIAGIPFELVGGIH